MTISHVDPRQLLPSDDEHGPIVRIGPDRREEAIERLTATGADSDPAHARRFIQFAQDQDIDLTWLWSRLDDRNRILHSALFVPSPGRTCMVFATNPVSRDQVRSLSGVLDAGCRDLLPQDLDLAQSLLEPGETLFRDALVGAAFSELATLSYLERPLPSKRARIHVTWPSGVTVEPFRDEMNDELIRVLDATYRNTLDCPGLLGLRRTEDILAGHRASGAFDPALWTMLSVDGRFSGALLLNPTPASRAVELVYMGLVPEARGRRLGGTLLNHGLSLLAGRAEHNITLAVDELNAPALALYRNSGFKPVLRRRAMIRSIHGDADTAS